jgi:hypothetical protein
MLVRTSGQVESHASFSPRLLKALALLNPSLVELRRKEPEVMSTQFLDLHNPFRGNGTTHRQSFNTGATRCKGSAERY